MGETRFELVKVEPPDLQSGSFSHSEILPDGYGRVRTDDLQVKSPLLYQLSYIPLVLNCQGAGGRVDPLASDEHIIAKGGWFCNLPPYKSCLCVRCESSFTLISKQEELSKLPIAAIAFHNMNLLTDVRHDFRPVVCLFIRVLME